MKKTLTRLTSLTLAAALLFSFSPGPRQKALAAEAALAAPISLEASRKAFLEKVDTSYSYDLAIKLTEIRSNEKLGYRTAGSPAEIATGDLLAEEMRAIGLQDVTKDEFTLDTWNFDHAELSFTTADGSQRVAVLGGYQTQFETNGPQEFTVIYGGQGTEADLAGLDAAGKLVLIEINQRDDWWINYPAYEAHLKGAAAVLAVQDGGYAEISDAALNAQDICGPADAPAFSISRADAEALLAAMAAQGAPELTVALDAVSTVGFDGKSYNIVGSIPGRNPDQMILMSAHYDSYFDGFQDDNAAIALMLGIAKALVDSGYQPEKTLVFCAMAAEEWGVSDTRYDWSTGAYNQIFRVHPEWAGKVMADINFELPAYSLGYDKTQIRSSYELVSFIEDFITGLPSVAGAFPAGAEVIAPTQTWSDDFSLSIAGVPSSVTALRGDFSQKYYHSQFDDKDTYDEAAFRYHHNMYGTLMLAYDQCAVPPLDFSTRLTAFEESVAASGLAELLGQEKAVPLTDAAERALAAAGPAYARIQEVNTAYAQALADGDWDAADQALIDAGGLYAQALAAFKLAEDSFVRLTWEDVSLFPHELAANNLLALKPALAALKDGDAARAVDAYLWQVDNNWYAYDWSYETYRYFTDYVLKAGPDRLMWGAGRIVGHEDLFQVIRSLLAKSETPGADLSQEISAVSEAIARQEALLEQLAAEELAALAQLTKALEGMAS